MKRGVILFVALLVLLSVSLAPHYRAVYASETTSLQAINPITGDNWFNFTTFNLRVGDTFTVDVEVANATDLQSWQFSLRWDPGLLVADHARLLPDEDIVWIPENGPPPPDTSVPGRLVWGWASLADTFNGSTVLASVEMRAISASGSCALSIDPAETLLLNRVQTEIPFTTLNGYYSLVSAPSGDLNSDGRIDMRDVSLAIAGFGSFPSTPRWNWNADMDSNGRIDLRDIGALIFNFGRA